MVDFENIKLYKDLINNPVIEIQCYLRKISKYNPEIPLVNIDGIYGPLTKNTVNMFQKIYGIPKTGVVDMNTWNMLVKEYDRLYKISCNPVKIDFFPCSDIEIRLGYKGDVVYIIQIILGKLNKMYNNYPVVEVTGVYDKNTEACIKKFQEVTILPVTGIVDKVTWDILAMMYETCRLNYI